MIRINTEPDLLKQLRHTKKVATRLEIIALTAEQKTPSEISRQLKISRPTVYRWQQRYQKLGLQALSRDLPRSGRKATFGAKKEQEIIQKAKSITHHSISSIAESSGISYGITRRILLSNNSQIKSKSEQSTCNFNFGNKRAISTSVLGKSNVITQKEVGKKCGLSQATVSLALSSSPLPNVETRIKVQKAAQKLGYIPTPSSSALINLRWQKKPRFTNIALLVPTHTQKSDRAFYTDLIKEGRYRGYAIDTITFGEQTKLETINNSLQQRGVQGVILGKSIYKTTALKLKNALQWERVTALAIEPQSPWLNFVEFNHNSQRVQRCMAEAVDKNYKRIAFLDLSFAQPIHRSWNAFKIATEINFQKIHHNLHTESNFPPLVIHNKNRREQITQLTNYLRRYSPEIILCDQDAGYTLLQEASKGTQTLPFISLNKQNKEDKSIAGLLADQDKDAIVLILQCLDKQIRGNERGIPELPTKYQPKPYKWIQGDSLLRKTQLKLITNNSAKNELPAGETKNAKNRMFKTLDLKKIFNCSTGIREQWHNGKTLKLNAGKQYFNQIPFETLSGDTPSQANALLMKSLKSPRNKQFPEQLTLPLKGYYRKGHILHTALWVSLSHTFASYQFIYDDNTTSTLPLHSYGPHHLVAKEIGLSSAIPEGTKPNIGDWYAHYQIKPEELQAEAGSFEFLNEQIDNPHKSYYLFTLEWENPHPEKALKALRIQSDINKGTTLAVLAVTLER